MGDFLKQGNAYLRGRGAALGLLYPFDYAFYERYGWCVACDAVRVRAPLSQLPSGKAPGGWRVGRASEGCAGLSVAYGRCYGHYSGHVLRDEKYFAIRLEELALDGGFAAVYEADGVPEAYLLYHFDGPMLCVDEIGCLGYGARVAALSFLANHASTARDVSWLCPPDEPVWRMLSNPRGAAVLEPYAMARVLDIEAAMDGLPAGEGKVTLNVRDEHAPWNAGCWTFAAREGRLRVTRAEAGDAAPIGVGELTQWALGYLSAAEMRGRGAGIPEREAAAMDALLGKQPVFLYEMY